MNTPGFTAESSLFKGSGLHRLVSDKNLSAPTSIQPASIYDLGPVCFRQCIQVNLPDGPHEICYDFNCFWPGGPHKG
jgi:hypothetical protein